MISSVKCLFVRNLKLAGIALLTLICLLFPAKSFAGSDDIPVRGALTYAKYFNTIRCGTPEKPCRGLKWPKPVVSIAIQRRHCKKIRGKCYRMPAVRKALNKVVGQINTIGAGLRLQLKAPDSYADISVFMTNDPVSFWLTKKPYPNALAEFAYSSFTKTGYLTKAQIRIGNTISNDKLLSVTLEETLQALGFPFDVSHPDALKMGSVFSVQKRKNNFAIKLTEWDRRMFFTVYGRR